MTSGYQLAASFFVWIVPRHALGRLPKVNALDRQSHLLSLSINQCGEMLGGRIGIDAHAVYARLDQNRQQGVCGVENRFVIPILLDPAFDGVLHLMEIDAQAGLVERLLRQRNANDAVVPMQVAALAVVTPKPMRITKLKFSGNLVHN